MSSSDRASVEQAADAVEAILERYLARLRASTESNEFLDVRLGHLLVTAVRSLVREGSLLDASEQNWLRMTVSYLITTDDAANDLSAIDGLDDDAGVVLGLLEAIGRPDLAKPILAHLQR